MEVEQTQVVESLDPDRTQVAVPSGAETTQAAIRIECPVCRTANPPGERWCQDCGFLLSAVPGEAPAEAPPVETLPRLVASSDGGREYLLRPGPNSVGRENADVLIPDATVSRRHATLTLSDGTVLVEDHGSTNGTRVAGEVLPPNQARAAYDGDELQFGNAVFTLALPGGSLRPAEAPEVPAAVTERPVAARLVGARGAIFPLYAGVNSLGRRSENDVVVRGDPYVSGRHAEIHCAEEGSFLVDVGSTNGTYLRSERLTPGERCPLAPGDELRLGQSTFIFEQEPAVGGAADAAVSAAEADAGGAERPPAAPVSGVAAEGDR